MSWLHKLGVQFIDKMILAFALIFVAISAQPMLNAESAMVDSVKIVLWVFISYLIAIVVVNILTVGVRTEDRFMRACLAVLTSGFIFWLFPKILWVGFLLMGLNLTADVEMVLIGTIVIRTFIRFYLGRRWKEG